MGQNYEAYTDDELQRLMKDYEQKLSLQQPNY